MIFAAVADEEAGCDLGSRFLVEQHRAPGRGRVRDRRVGGFSLHLGDTTFYPVQVAEKGFCWVRARVTGEPGHGSMPRHDSAVTRLGEALAKLGRHAAAACTRRAYVTEFLDAVRARQPALIQPLVKLLARPHAARARGAAACPDVALARSFSALLSNTAAATVVRAGARPT